MPAHDLQSIANELRLDVLSMARGEFNVHLAGPMSSAEIFATLYFGGIVRLDPNNPNDPTRDRVVLSCGHYVPILYAALSRAGYFSKEKLLVFGKIGGLPVHPELVVGKEFVPGIEASTGPLAQGMSVAVGMAIGLKKQRSTAHVFCVVSDGELQEGQAWEAITLAVREKLDNLIFIIDNNNVQIEHYVTELSGSIPIVGRLEASDCHTFTVSGNDVAKLDDTLHRAKSIKGQVVAVVAKTIGGKGVSFMENLPKWHDGKLSDEQFQQAMKELLG